MKETKFTEGDWELLPAEADKNYLRIRGTALGRRYKIVDVPDLKLNPVGTIAYERERVESLANAYLIKTAPKLYTEIEDEIEFLRKFMVSNFTVNCSQSSELSDRIDTLSLKLLEARGESNE